MKTQLNHKLNQYSQLERAEQKRIEGERIARFIRFSSPSRIVQALADRIQRCNAPENLWTATEMHNPQTGELFDGRGNLWSCNSRLCPSCVGRLARRNRKIMRGVMQSEKLLLGTNWRFVTLTMPDLALKDLNLLKIRAVINSAWRRFSRSAWFGSKIFGGAKSEEFTLGKHSQLHYHLHLLAVCKWLDAAELRREWTKCLRSAFKKHGVAFDVNSSDGLAVCHIQRVDNREKSILEICKYVTKSDSWSKIPSEQLAELAEVERMPRMFELFGSAKVKARELAENTLTEPLNAENRHSENTVSPNKNAYLDTRDITVSFSNSNLEVAELVNHSPPQKRLNWRKLCRILPRAEWLKHLDQQIEACRQYRTRQLQEKYAFATFILLSEYEKN